MLSSSFARFPSLLASGGLVVLPVLLGACGSPPPEAPDDVNDLVTFLSVHFDDATPDELLAGVANVETLLDGLDLTASDVDERAYTVGSLTEENLGGMPVHEGFDPALQVPVAVAGVSSFGLDEQLRIIEEPNHICIGSATTVAHSRTFRTDLQCFLDQTCDRLTVDEEIRKESFLASVWYDQVTEFRWLTLEDGRRAIVSRNYLPAPFVTDSGGGSWDQSYGVSVRIDADGTTKKFNVLWASVDVGGLGDNLWASSVKNGIDEAGGFQDDFLNNFADGLCGNDRDAVYDRPGE